MALLTMALRTGPQSNAPYRASAVCATYLMPYLCPLSNSLAQVQDRCRRQRTSLFITYHMYMCRAAHSQEPCGLTVDLRVVSRVGCGVARVAPFALCCCHVQKKL